MKIKLPSLQLSLTVAILLCVGAGWWAGMDIQVGAQTYCPVPESMGDHGDYNRGRWESFQRVTVKLYPGAFNSDERQAIREVLDEFETAGDTANCSRVLFIEMVEEEFPNTPGETPGVPSALDTLYLVRRSVEYWPDFAGGREDRHGNRFRYRAKVKDERGAQLGRWAWDVFLVRAP